MSTDEKEKKFEAAQEAYQAAKLALPKAESELNSAAAEYYQSRFGVTIGASVIECPSEKIPLSLIVGLIRVTGGICQWQLAPIQKDGEPASRVYHLPAEAPITVLGEYKGKQS